MASTQPLAGKVVLITGASKGIGAATALELASLGAKLVINYSSDSKPADELVQKIGTDKAIAIKADAADVKEIERLVAETVSWGGRIDILIPNAAVSIIKALEQTEEADFQKTMDLNVKGPYFLAQKALPHMSPGSRIILLSTSLCNWSPITPNYLLYVTSKGAIEQMVRILAKDLGTKGINVNCVAPGPTATDLFYQGKSEELINRIASNNPFNRIARPEEIAKAIAYFAGEGGSWVNGQILRVNGGMTVGT
ncbi:NAD(P)-binding protein [Macroventuria anomochaeta]|uniref:NAD(P)-binding protein n=1 Tax=Macroventuria anomochaeta TaxID=301207 RepID=A0ACB6RI08_9PLEO|nr:NAD(P)-binding protein [Macroventuria anomochaeta]KAF2621521.1 NAD(P)-binding protein [Macroventuria anomochaeta]